MWPESRTLRGAIIGGLLAVAIHFAIRFAFRHWRLLLVLWALAMINQQCSAWSGGSARTEVLASFEREAVALRNVVGLPYAQGRPGISFISATVSNGASATIYDIRLVCRYQTRGRDGSSLVWSEYHLGEIAPGGEERITVAVSGSGLLADGIPDSLQCEPMFDFVARDLLHARGRPDLDDAAGIEIEMAVESRAEPHGRRSYWVYGLITNASSKRFARANVECRVRTRGHGPSKTISNAIYLRVSPGSTAAFRVRVGDVTADRDADGQHCRVLGIETVAA